MKKKTPGLPLPSGLAKPAQRALSGAGITTLTQLAQKTEEEISSLHGIGKNAILVIRKELALHGLSLAAKKMQ